MRSGLGAGSTWVMGPRGYIAVMVVLGGYFLWLVARMAAFNEGGYLRIEKLGAGFAGICLAVALGTLLAIRDRRSGE
jgi:hypothetical protein